MQIYLQDKAEIDLQQKSVNLCRTGVYNYLAKELNIRDREPNDIIRVNRDEASVQKIIDKVNEYGVIPVLINHPEKFVDLKDNMSYKRGGVGKIKLKDNNGEKVANGKILAISDEIKELMNKGQEVSMGYTAELVLADNSLYDYNLKIDDVNHLALVDYGRAGGTCSIQDKSLNYKKLIIDKLNEEENMSEEEIEDKKNNSR